MNSQLSDATDLEAHAIASRRRISEDSGLADDIAVLLGLVIIGRIDSNTVRAALDCDVLLLRRSVDKLVMSNVVPSTTWAELHRLWYRWKIPFGTVSLTWWYLFCVALRREQDTVLATDRFERWLQYVESAELADRPAIYFEFLGIVGQFDVVAVRRDVGAFDCLAVAVLGGYPLIRLTAAEHPAALERSKYRVIYSDVTPKESFVPKGTLSISRRSVDLDAFCFGRPPRLHDDLNDLTRTWGDLLNEERTMLLVTIEQRIAALEQIRISYGGVLYDNDGVANVLATCRANDVTSWSPIQLRIASALWIWHEAGFVLQELNQAEVSLALLRVFLERRTAEYEDRIEQRVSTGLPLLDLAREFSSLRARVERRYLRCLYFDGGNWERREFLLSRSNLSKTNDVPASLRSDLSQRFNAEFPEVEPSVAWKRYLRQLLKDSFTPTDLLVEVANWAVKTFDLAVDYAIFTVPLGTSLRTPWAMELEEVFCYTAIRAGFVPLEHEIPLSIVGIRNAIGQRMRYNVVKKAQNYALVKRMKPQSFNLPDIAVAEDAHQGGHRAAGLRLTCRIPMTIQFEGSEWKGIGDVRLNRTTYNGSNRFRENDIVIASRYAAWAKAIAEETYALGLTFDRKFCCNLDDGRDIGINVGSAK